MYSPSSGSPRNPSDVLRRPVPSACHHCRGNIEALRRYAGLLVSPVDGRDQLPHQAFLACGHCKETCFWAEPRPPELPSAATRDPGPADSDSAQPTRAPASKRDDLPEQGQQGRARHARRSIERFLRDQAATRCWSSLSWVARRKHVTPSAVAVALSVLVAFRDGSSRGPRAVSGLLAYLALGSALIALDSFMAHRGWRETVALPAHSVIWLVQLGWVILLATAGMMRASSAFVLLVLLGLGHLWCRAEAEFHQPPLEPVYLPGADRGAWDADRVRRVGNTWRSIATATGLGSPAERQPSGFRPDVIDQVEVDGHGARLVISIGEGRTPKSFKAKAPAIAVAFNVYRCDVEAVGNDRVRLRLVEKDPFRSGVTIRPQRPPGRRVAIDDPWELGVSEDGKPVLVPIARGKHILIPGKPGTGKSTTASGLIAHVLGMDTAMVCVADPHGVLVHPFRDLLPWSHAGADPEPLCQLLRWIVSEFDRRKRLLESMRVGNLEPEHFSRECPLIVLVIDEVSVYLTGPRKEEIAGLLRRIASEGRKFGVRAVLCIQRPDATIMRLSIRDQLDWRICFPMESAVGVNMVMPMLENPRDLLTSVRVGVGYTDVVAGSPLRFLAHDIDPYEVGKRLRAEGLGRRPFALPAHDDSPPKSETLLDLLNSGEISRGTFQRLGPISLAEAAAYSEQELRAMKGHHESSVVKLRQALERRELSLRTDE